MTQQPKAFIGVGNVYRGAAEQGSWTVSFVISGNGAKGSILVPVDHGAFRGENILKVARNRLRIFTGLLADQAVQFALTDQEVSRLRSDYEPDPLRR